MTCMMNGDATGWGMDYYVSGCGTSSNANNFAIADTTSTGSASVYGKIAKSTISTTMNSAIMDHFFQSAIGASSENDMYFAIPQFMFVDNTVIAQNSSMNGARCYSSAFDSYYAPTIYDLLNSCSVTWAMYAEGWNTNPSSSQCYPSYFDATDYGESYFPSLTKNPGANWRDYSQFATDVTNNNLPSVAHVRGMGIHSEHPAESTITASTTIINAVINAVGSSSYYNQNTLIFVIPDESGGFYDHIAPPTGVSAVDGQFLGPRIPAVVIGYAVKAPSSGGYVSHQKMEISSVTKFIEWNWLNGVTGQLGGRDATAANIGSVLDSTKTTVTVPDF